MEQALSEVCKDIRIGKILIQTNSERQRQSAERTAGSSAEVVRVWGDPHVRRGAGAAAAPPGDAADAGAAPRQRRADLRRPALAGTPQGGGGRRSRGPAHAPLLELAVVQAEGAEPAQEDREA